MNGSHLCELLTTMASLYCGPFVTLEVGAVQHETVCGYIAVPSSRQAAADSRRLVFTCKVSYTALMSLHLIDSKLFECFSQITVA